MRNVKLTVTAAVLIGLLASASMGAVVVDLRFTDGTTSKVLSSADAGTTITIQLWAQVTGTNAVKKEGIGHVYASAKSVQGATGVLIGGTGVGITGYTMNSMFYKVGASQNGAVSTTLSSDNIQDWGSASTMTNAVKASSCDGGTTPIYYTRDPAPTYNHITNGTEYLLGTFSFKIGSINMSAGTTAYTDLVCVKPTWAPNNTYHNTFKDELSDTAATSYSVGSGVRFIIPEPATLALIVVGAMGLLARRRRSA